MNESQSGKNQTSGSVKPENEKRAEEFYRELFDLVMTSISGKIDQQKIEPVLKKLNACFRGAPYDPLLLLSYTHSQKNYIVAHITNNTILASAFGCSLGLSDEDLMDLVKCAFAHDFGMVQYTHLFQSNQPLSEDENRLIQQHPLKSAEMFQGQFSDRVLNAVTDVHEYANGQGYPNKKQGVEISILAKMTAVCDVFEALTHARNYRKEMSPYDALKIIIKKKDTIFDGKIVKRFVDFLSIYPVGSIVMLNTGETGMVVGANSGYPTKSVVRILLTPKKDVEKSVKTVNLLKDDMVYIAKAIQDNEEKEILKVLKPRGDMQLQ